MLIAVAPHKIVKVEPTQYDSDEKDYYIRAILAWNQENMETKIDFKEISVVYSLSEESILFLEVLLI